MSTSIQRPPWEVQFVEQFVADVKSHAWDTIQNATVTMWRNRRNPVPGKRPIDRLFAAIHYEVVDYVPKAKPDVDRINDAILNWLDTAPCPVGAFTVGDLYALICLRRALVPKAIVLRRMAGDATPSVWDHGLTHSGWAEEVKTLHGYACNLTRKDKIACRELYRVVVSPDCLSELKGRVEAAGLFGLRRIPAQPILHWLGDVANVAGGSP